MIDFGLVGLVIIVIVLSLLALGISALLIPSRLFLTITKEGPITDGNLLVKWLGRKVIDRRLFGPPKVEVVGREREQRRDRLRHTLETIKLAAKATPYLLPVLKSVFRSVSFEGVSGNIKFGLEDPVDTAVIFGFISSVVAIASVIPNSTLVATPMFGQQIIDGSLKVELRVRPIHLVVALVRAYRHEPVRRLFKEIRE